MELWKQQAEFTYDVSELLQFIHNAGYFCTFGEVYRTQKQADWNAEHKVGIKNSLHCYRLAIDLNLFSKDGTYLTHVADYVEFGKFWEQLNPRNRWGGNFCSRDGNHFQRNME